MKRGLILLMLIVSSATYLPAQVDDSASHEDDGHVHQHDDAVTNRVIQRSILSSDFTEEIVVPLDTVFGMPHHFRRADEYSTFNATLGNYGLPFYQVNFFDRVTDPDKHLYANYYPLMHTASNAEFMNTQVPFTEMKWTNTEPREKAEQTFRIKHSQNVNRYLNFGLIYDIVYDLGQYNYQKAEDKTFTLFSSFTGKRYSFYFSGGINNIINEENGGMSDTDRNSLKGLETEDVPLQLTSLNKSESVLKNKNILFVQKFNLEHSSETQVTDSTSKAKHEPWLKGSISHIMEMEGNRRTYSDAAPGSGFYDSIYINSTVTFDSLVYRNIKNTLRFDFLANENGRFRLAGGAGIRHEHNMYGQIFPSFDSTLADTLSWYRDNVALVGKLSNDIGDNFNWTAYGELYLSGFRSGDFKLNGIVTKELNFKKGTATWNITGGINNTTPSLWYSRRGGNNFYWNDLDKMKKEFRTDVGTSFSYPERSFDVELNYSLIDNYTYFDLQALPDQAGSTLSVASLMVSKDLKAWKFHLDSDVLLQKSSNETVLDLPLVTVRSALYFQHLFRFKRTGGKLNMQLGGEVSYNTPYYAYSYMPATGVFYNQDKTTVGDYPFVDVFLNLHLKRARLFIMFDHVNQGLTGFNYFLTPYYPMNIRTLRYGLAWTFYN